MSDDKAKEYLNNYQNPEQKTGKKESNSIQKLKLDQDSIDTLELNILKLTQVINKLNEIDKTKFSSEIKILKDIENDYNNLFNIKLSKKEKEISLKLMSKLLK